MGKYMMILMALLTFSCSTIDGEEEEVSQKKTKTLKVMTYNIHYCNPPSKGGGIVDLAAIANVINTENPDLVALQEVDRLTDRSGYDLDQAKELAELTSMHHYFAKAIDFSNGEYGVAILSRFPIKSGNKHALPAVGAEAELRTIGLIEVELEGGQNLYFASTHLDFQSKENRIEQVKEMTKFLKPYQEVPIIVGGDFNMSPTDSVWNYLEDFQMGCFTCPSTFPATEARATIDYLLLNESASNMFSVTNYRTVQEDYASDHLPLVMELEKAGKKHFK